MREKILKAAANNSRAMEVVATTEIGILLAWLQKLSESKKNCVFKLNGRQREREGDLATYEYYETFSSSRT